MLVSYHNIIWVLYLDCTRGYLQFDILAAIVFVGNNEMCPFTHCHKEENARSIINKKKTELNIMVDDIKPNIIGITESWANNDITDAELGLEGYAMFRKDRIGRRGGGVLIYINETIPAYEVQLKEETDCNEAIWCKLVTGHTTVTIGVVYRCTNIYQTEQRKNTQCYK